MRHRTTAEPFIPVEDKSYPCERFLMCSPLFSGIECLSKVEMVIDHDVEIDPQNINFRSLLQRSRKYVRFSDVQCADGGEIQFCEWGG